MISKILFDFDEQFKPVIIASIAHRSDDVRDKLAKQFIEQLGYDSNLLNIQIDNTNSDVTKRYTITPIKDVSGAITKALVNLHPNKAQVIRDFMNELNRIDFDNLVD